MGSKRMIVMDLDLPGRVRNTKLPLSKALLPVFEAVVNSLQSLEELPKPSDGKIILHVIRNQTQARTGKEAPAAPVSGFIIEDNGVGFTDDNFRSFNTADSTWKMKRGGKGIGRFIWLKSFRTVSVESAYIENGKSHVRSFSFSLDGGISDAEPVEKAGVGRATKITLHEMFDEYSEKCPKDLNVIATRLLEHCLTYFVKGTKPKIVVMDEDESIDLLHLFNENVKRDIDTRKFAIKGKDFSITNLRLYASTDDKHKLHYCANGREVTSETIGRFVPDLNKKLKDDAGTFVCVSYVESDFLDKAVNAERTEFAFPDEVEELDMNEVTRDELRNASLDQVKDFLRDQLEPLAKEKQTRIQDYIIQKAPRFRALLKHKRDYLERIPAGLDDRLLDLKLYEAYHSEELSLLKTGESLLRTDISSVQNRDKYRKEFNEFVEKVNDFGKSQLADYVSHRKVILDLLNANLRFVDDKYAKEEAIHEIIFPLKAVSEDVPFESQNLWIIDERLSYHSYLASDVPLSEILEARNLARPDLLIFDEPFAFATEEIPPASVVIIEFKRPDRRDYTDDENPIDQIYDYVRDIRLTKKKDRNGRQIVLKADVPFYGYLICDLNPSMLRIAENKGLTPSPDGLGFFGFNERLKTYVEVISYSKLVEDARKRNQILFDKLLFPKAVEKV